MCEGKVPLIRGPPRPGGPITGPLTLTEWMSSNSLGGTLSRGVGGGAPPYSMVQDAASQDSAGEPVPREAPTG